MCPNLGHIFIFAHSYERMKPLLKISKRCIALLMALVLVLGTVPTAFAAETTTEPTITTESTISTDPTETLPLLTVRASDQLQAALSILQYLEECGIIGEVASVDVSDLGNLQLMYGQRFLVKLGDTTQLLYKIKCMNAAINGTDPLNSLKEYDSGVLDITFTVKPNDVIYQADTE